jgi:hypothetical protein
VKYALDAMVDVAGRGSRVSGMGRLGIGLRMGNLREKESWKVYLDYIRVQRSTHTGKRHDTLYCPINSRKRPKRGSQARTMISITNFPRNTIKRMAYCLVMMGVVG